MHQTARTAKTRSAGDARALDSWNHRRLELWCRIQSASASSETLPSARARISATTSASVAEKSWPFTPPMLQGSFDA
jgi:hypothetical protein